MSERKFRGRFKTSYMSEQNEYTETVVPSLGAGGQGLWSIRKFKNGARQSFTFAHRSKPELWEEDKETLSRVWSCLSYPAREHFNLWLKEMKGEEK